ncbi:MAG: hypothetical protein EXR07_02260 [Acetobacteraceae bacterium]|nr:hypothetical protein [Acetobacteraceae bacterium]
MPDETVTHRAMITACATGATLSQSLDQTVANLALPYMQGSFSARYDQITWVLRSYVVEAEIMTAPRGIAGDEVRTQAIEYRLHHRLYRHLDAVRHGTVMPRNV